MRKIFVDTGAWDAIADGGDPNHEPALFDFIRNYFSASNVANCTKKIREIRAIRCQKILLRIMSIIQRRNCRAVPFSQFELCVG